MTIWKADFASDQVGVVRESGTTLLLHRQKAAPDKHWRILCLVEDQYRKNLRSSDKIEFVSDPEDDFDLFVAPNPSAKGVFENILARCSNPAAPLVTTSSVFGARADIVVAQPTAASVAAAIASLEPLVARVSALPRIPQGADRNGLLALALAYTRNSVIEGQWEPCSPQMIGYPLLLGIANARSVLENLAEAGLVRRRFYERLHVCDHCDSSQLHARESCINCHSSHLTEHSLVHHYSCGFQAAQRTFEHRDGYVCPKCHKLLRHYGVDYDKPGMVVECQACGESMTEPEVGFICASCGRYTSGDDAGRRDWYHYEFLADGLSALRASALPHADSAEVRNGCSLRDFRLILGHSLSVAQQHRRPITAWRLTIDADGLAKQVGRRGAVEVCQLMRELVVENMRSGDVVAGLPAGIVACLSETDAASAEAELERIRGAIARTIQPHLEINIEIFENERIGVLLQDLQ
ncbi:hypothetical protein [Chelativorans sp. AA-79]|uniref:TackOD1 domain-containing metal-binding protein n=1 Tax=Chelativorans sp. AA-79 TaxID=3028735 RepID=UPI0023F70095|nr:hypothetical protein [Chelativorans sp. AA-79]WEX09060.1 hypothetical protein PVE73_23950 [Chelativorans sp. AA-79]